MQMELAIRFEYGTVVPWVSRMEDGRLRAVAGPDQIVFAAPIELRGEDLKTRAEFAVEEGQTIPFALTWSRSFGADAAAVRRGGGRPKRHASPGKNGRASTRPKGRTAKRFFAPSSR